MLQEQREGPYCPEACGDDLQDDIYLAAGGGHEQWKLTKTYMITCIYIMSRIVHSSFLQF